MLFVLLYTMFFLLMDGDKCVGAMGFGRRSGEPRIGLRRVLLLSAQAMSALERLGISRADVERGSAGAALSRQQARSAVRRRAACSSS